MALNRNVAELVEPADGRRRFMNRFAALGSGVFVAAAVRGTRRAPNNGNFACCHLAFPNGPFCHSCGYACWTCPSGAHTTVWYCCESGRLWGCGECQVGGASNCEAGTSYKCSYPFRTGVVC